MQLTPQAKIDDYTARGWWGDLTVDALLQRNRDAAGQRPALVDPLNRRDLDGAEPRRFSWAQVGEESDRLASALLNAGLCKDDVVCAQLPNVTEAVLLALACSRIGLILCPVVMQYRRHELDHILGLVSPKAFVTTARFSEFDHVEQANALRVAGPGAFQVMTLGGTPHPDALDLSAAARIADPHEAAAYSAAHPTGPGEVLTICWTSGTEAKPKGVPRDHNHWIVNARMVSEAADLREGETLLNPFPLVNVASFGIVLPWLWKTGVLVLHHPFDLPVYLRQIVQEQVNYTIAPPAVLNMLLKDEALAKMANLSSVRAIGSGSAPLSPWMIEGFRTRHGIEVSNIFGSNEGCSLFSGPMHVPDTTERARYFPRWGAEGLDWDGETASMIRTRLVDPVTETEVTERGVPGELRIAGAATMTGYWNAPAVTRAAFDDAGWFKTGDLFEIAGEDEPPRFYLFVGRCKDIIVRGGVNISPAEIDDLLTGWPQAKEAAVVGVPDEIMGERVCVAVVPTDADAPPTLQSVTDWLKARGVAVFKLPERLILCEALPRNAMNKVVRTALRESVIAQGR